MLSPNNSVTSKFREQLNQLGKVALSAKYPNDFEVYIMSLELTDSDDNTVNFLSFPVMPNQITKTEPKKVNIKKSASGVTVLVSDSITPGEIIIKGDFGRSFKIVLQPSSAPAAEGYGFTGFNKGAKNLAFNTPEFDGAIKSGFGVIKILQSMINDSVTLDSKGKPHKLYLYNMALSESYLVSATPQGIQYSQGLNRNMIWEYSITFAVICPLERVRTTESKTSAKVLLKASVMQNSANSLGAQLKSFV